MAPKRGFSSFAATLIGGLALALALLFMWRVWKYYDQITKGQTVELPQFTGQFTAGRTAGARAVGQHPEVATSDDPSIGPADAKLTIVEFLDYQCPYSGEESSIVRELTNGYKDSVRFIIRDFPIQELHPDALAGAEAAGCAEAQGKFWQMHDRLFALQGHLTRPDLDRAAQQSGLDMDVFAACMSVHARLDEIQRDAADGAAAGVSGTPTFFFNGSKVEGAIPRATFETLIGRYLNP
jgi:protein-disulfide isomerase